MTKTEPRYPEPRMAPRPWADYGDEDQSTSFCLDAWTVREGVVESILDGRLSSEIDFGVASSRARRAHRDSDSQRGVGLQRDLNLPVPSFRCFECGAQFEDDPDPQYGDCPHCKHAGAVGLADSEEG